MSMKTMFRYVPVSDEARTRNWRVLGGGYAFVPPGASYPPVRHPSPYQFEWSAGRVLHDYQLLYITRGGGTFESEAAGQRRLRQGDLFVLFPGVWHRYCPDESEGWDEHWVAFNGNGIRQALVELETTPASPIRHVGIHEVLLSEYREIFEELTNEDVGYADVLAARVRLLLALAAAVARRREFEGTSMVRTIEAAKCAMLEHIDQPLSMAALATQLGVSHSWFRRVFHRYTGMSPIDYYLEIRLNQAKQLLGATTISIGDVGSRVGFDSAYYFSRMFKQKTGLTPSEYRKQAQRRPQL